MVELFQTDVSIWLALSHGILAFFSPCVLPLIPAFVGVVLSGEKRLQRLFGFFFGFSIIFTLLGALSSFVGTFLGKFGSVIEKILGAAIVVLGILFIFEMQIFKAKGVNVWKFKGSGFLGGVALGSAIGFVWIPCSSPVLGSILLIASQKSVLRGMILLFVYSLGISVPFLTIGSALSKVLTIGFGKPVWEKWIRFLGGAFIVLLGVLMIFGKMKV